MRLKHRFLLLSLLSAACFNVTAETRFESPQFKFSVEYPSQYQEHKQQNPQVLLAVYGENSGLPSFNIVAEPGQFQGLTRGLQTTAKALEESYKLVGIQNSKTKSCEPLVIQGLSGTTCTLEFKTDKSIVSQVALLQFRNYHLIFTFMYPPESHKDAIDIWNKIMASFNYFGPEQNHTKNPSFKAGRFWPLIPIGLLLIGLLVSKRWGRH